MKVTLTLTFDAAQCVDVTPDQYDPAPDLQNIMEFGAEHYNLRDWQEHNAPKAGIRKVLDLSTGHLPEATANAIDAGTFPKPTMMESEYGWLFSVPELADFPELVDGLPCKAFKAVMRYAAQNDCTAVLFDRDGETLDGLELFDW